MRVVSMLILAAGFVATLVAAVAAQSGPDEQALVARAREIHKRVLTIDTHDDIPFNFATPEVDPAVRGDRQVDLPKMREGGLDVAFFIVFVGQSPRTPENYEKAKADAMTKFDAIHRLTEKMHPDTVELAYSPDDVERIHKSGKLVACIGIENGYVIGKDLSLLKKYHALGARYITLAHGGHNDIADSATPRQDEPQAEHDGVSEFGRQVVAEMNRVGIMVDVSHISKKAALDAIRLSKAPVIASHSGARAVNDHTRNLDDETLLALKKNGGVVQTVALGSFVKNDPPEKRQALEALRKELGITGFGPSTSLRAGRGSVPEDKRPQYERRRAELDARWPPANVNDFVNHIDHMVKLVGLDHVGISSDFDGGGGIVGWNDASETPNVTIELVRRGYTEAQISKLWGGNLLRVWREVEKVARQSGKTNQPRALPLICR
jgi:membrane dipeptidase